MDHLDTDYLIAGAGAMGMAFADVILADDPSARIVMVDRHAEPGGHWNDAYPFVRLHQPAAFYGLNSTNLGQGGEDLASHPELIAYYRTAMDRFQDSGRLRFLPRTEYTGDGRIVSVSDSSGATALTAATAVTTGTRVTARRRIVDATYMNVTVPSVCPPRYLIDPGVTVIPPNDLAQISRLPQRCVVIGAGKTGIDAILFLLDRGVAPDRIQWIVSHDSWLFNRATIQPGCALETVAAMVEAIAAAIDIDDVYLRLERQGILWRIDTASLPTKWRCATVDQRELTNLRRIDDVVRLGRVQRVSRREIHLDRGTIDAADDSLYIDCSANGLAKVPARPLFAPGHITLQSVFMCQQTFSAALIAHLELLNTGDERRNRICGVVPHPELAQDLLPTLLASSQNVINWHLRLPIWLIRSRLYLAHYEKPHHYLRSAAKIVRLQRRAVASMNRMLATASAAQYVR